MAKGDEVHVVDEGKIPADYHCRCAYCSRSLGELKRPDGSNYSRHERNEYYVKEEKGDKGHVAKTPLHIARWLVQRFTRPGDWVLDPTIGAGTTGVEALTQGRNVAGMEIQFADALNANLRANKTDGLRAKIRIGDARRIGSFLNELGERFALVVNNPPYSGDQHMSTFPSAIREGSKHKSGTFKYADGLPNLAFLKEGPAYWEAMREIYAECVKHLERGGHFAFGIKDMTRNKKPFMLHSHFNDLLDDLKMQHVGTAFLRHHPTTYHLNTYHKMHGAHPPYFQTISVFRKT